MTAERLLLELASDDVPKISSGKFNWRPVEGSASQAKTDNNQIPIQPQASAPAAAIPLAFRESLGAPTLTAGAFPLNMLENKTFMGTGMNMIWRPRSSADPKNKIQGDAVVAGTDQDVLQFNMTAESMAFSGSIGEAIPNRGAKDQADISLQGIPYVQRVGSFEDPAAFSTDETKSSKAKKPEGIHFETGCFMFVPETITRPKQGATLNRMASIPHGTTINAQGLAPPASTKPMPGKPPKGAANGGIPVIDIIPLSFAQDPNTLPPPGSVTKFMEVPDVTKFTQGPGKKPLIPGQRVAKSFPQHLKFDDSAENRLPARWKEFFDQKIITQETFNDPNEVLRRAIKDQEIESFVTFTLTTAASDTIRGGGISNIGFLEGPPADRDAGKGNAQPIQMSVTYWIETVKATLTIKPGVSSQQAFQMINSAGVLGPLFVAPPTSDRNKPISKTVTWTQLQYSQNVTLNFNGLSWPHISVATLGETGTKNVDLPPL